MKGAGETVRVVVFHAKRAAHDPIAGQPSGLKALIGGKKWNTKTMPL
jgi:hypothetical protein